MISLHVFILRWNSFQTVVNEDGVNSLIILSVSRYDAGEYMCVAKNKAGENKFTVQLNVLGKSFV